MVKLCEKTEADQNDTTAITKNSFARIAPPALFHFKAAPDPAQQFEQKPLNHPSQNCRNRPEGYSPQKPLANGVVVAGVELRQVKDHGEPDHRQRDADPLPAG